SCRCYCHCSHCSHFLHFLRRHCCRCCCCSRRIHSGFHLCIHHHQCPNHHLRHSTCSDTSPESAVVRRSRHLHGVGGNIGSGKCLLCLYFVLVCCILVWRSFLSEFFVRFACF